MCDGAVGWEGGHSPGKGVSWELVVGVDMVGSRSNLQNTRGLRALWSWEVQGRPATGLEECTCLSSISPRFCPYCIQTPPTTPANLQSLPPILTAPTRFCFKTTFCITQLFALLKSRPLLGPSPPLGFDRPPGLSRYSPFGFNPAMPFFSFPLNCTPSTLTTSHLCEGSKLSSHSDPSSYYAPPRFPT